MSQTVADLVRHAGVVLKAAGIEDAPREARSLVALALETQADRISVMARDAAPAAAMARLETLVERRTVARVPLTHLTGWRDFYRHRFEVSSAVLDPRSDTETLVEAALEQSFDHVLDLGTGSGCILLSLLSAQPGAAGVGTDISPDALAVADRNARRLKLADRVMLLRSDWYEAVEGRFDLIVSNPPYIAVDEMKGLAPELSHEPRIALTDESDGLEAYRRLVPGAPAHLRPDGRLLVEIGHMQAADVTRLFETAGFREVAVMRDLEGRDRVVGGKMPAGPL
ncbi:peptide chain release factor N(5)-glutamine methyltransferase [Roseovarius sp.]|uniref:peptide chain release factor N(5)-glutamine methyltransferase n=1 Tax=Roseovarius sp. TaxID=1486281 RepID=UPI003D1359E9